MDTAKLEQQLTRIGLSEKEAVVLLALLRHGTRTTSFIAKKSSLNRGTTYVALHSLLEKGLVVKSTKRKVQYFTGLEPRHLVAYLDQKKREIQTERETLLAMLPDLEAIVNPLTSKPKIEFFDGVEGVRSAIEQTLNATDRTLRAYLSLIDLGEFLGWEYFVDYTKRRIKSGYTLNAIRTHEKDKQAQHKAQLRNIHEGQFDSSESARREVRHISEELAFPISVYLYDDKVTLLSSQEESFALTITSREYSEMQKKLFSVVWNSLTEATEKVERPSLDKNPT